ncbi:hypothetical protein [Nocardia cyriacigeorgica]|uniref:hypothetical protein n=1 Tax=Nocardia cyriacigeorgica TaxID=135487 RepID=UPI00245708B0|nr:hypothetical protein [Nocardia cyriacigeorgica]
MITTIAARKLIAAAPLTRRMVLGRAPMETTASTGKTPKASSTAVIVQPGAISRL